MTELARRYEHGIGCPRDIGRALFWYKRAAAQNEPDAMVALGDLYDAGVCVDRDAVYAREMYRRAADLGFAPAMMRVAAPLETPERSEALQWYRRAADAGYGPAMTRLGDLLNDPAWFRKAVAAGHPPAFSKLAASGPLEQAVELWSRGAELGDAASMTALGIHFEKSEPGRAMDFFRQGARAGDGHAMERFAYHSERTGQHGDAVEWWVKAAEAGNSAALTRVARLHEEGSALARDPDKALRLYKQAADAGHIPAMTRLAILTKNDAMLRSAADLGDADAMFALGNLEGAAAGGHTEALARLGRTEEAARLGHPASLRKLGRVREAALVGDPEAMRLYGHTISDPAQGIAWIRRSAEAGDVVAMRELGVAYASGAGLPVDEAQSQRWLRAAADKGDAEALYRVGEVAKSAAAGHAPAMVRMGETTGERSWFERAAAQGYANAWTKLGELKRGSEAGDPEAKFLLAERERNAHRAYKLYREAADGGYGPAMRKLGDCHTNGRGTSRSEVDAVNWYRRAAMAGDEESKQILERLGKSL
jgi:TPR repeat protein